MERPIHVVDVVYVKGGFNLNLNEVLRGLKKG